MTLDDLELLFLTFGEFRGIWQIFARWRWRLLQSTIISRHFSCFDKKKTDINILIDNIIQYEAD